MQQRRAPSAIAIRLSVSGQIIPPPIMKFMTEDLTPKPASAQMNKGLKLRRRGQRANGRLWIRQDIHSSYPVANP